MNGKAAYVALQTGTPTLAWGRPGTGKTSWVKMVAKHLNMPCEIVIASIREPSDFAGLPILTQDDDVRLAPPNWARRLNLVENGILFLDELSTAPPAVQSAALRVVNERAVGDIYLKDSIWIIAAANPTDTSSGTWTLSAALANRFLHIDWNVLPKSWVEGMLSGWKVESNLLTLPSNWRENIPQTRALVASFIQVRPALLLDEPENADLAGKSWPSPRTWEMVSNVLAASRAVGADTDIEIELLAGCVGGGASGEFMTWERNLDLPDPAEVLANPSIFKLPERDDQIFAALSSVVAWATANLTKKMWNAGWEVLAIAADGGAADLAAIPAKTLALARPDGYKVPKQIKAFIPVLQLAGLLGD